VRFKRNKFRELVVYIAEQTVDDPGFGDTHLNKVLYWSDFRAYSEMGDPLTGARFFKLPYGPAAKPLIGVRDELVAEGAVEVIEPPLGSKTARKTIPQRAANTKVFSQSELRLVDEVIHKLKGRTAIAVSRRSHKEPGWKLVDMYEDIPYDAALIARDRAPAEVRQRGEALAASLGW
jgi:hypothetical protein